MELNRRRSVIRLLVLAALITACVALVPKDGAEACVTCVRLDPGSAIKYGCMQVQQGDVGCTPTDVGCRMAGVWCRVRPSGGGGGGGGGGWAENFDYGYGDTGYCSENWMWDAGCSGPDDSYAPMSGPAY